MFRKVTYSKLLVLILDTGTLVDNIDVVRKEGVSRVLRDDAERNNNCQPPPISFGSEKVQIAASSLCVTVSLDRLLDLPVLELHGWVVHVAASVMLC